MAADFYSRMYDSSKRCQHSVAVWFLLPQTWQITGPSLLNLGVPVPRPCPPRPRPLKVPWPIGAQRPPRVRPPPQLPRPLKFSLPSAFVDLVCPSCSKPV
jgi:hypothetical protein